MALRVDDVVGSGCVRFLLSVYILNYWNKDSASHLRSLGNLGRDMSLLFWSANNWAKRCVMCSRFGRMPCLC